MVIVRNKKRVGYTYELTLKVKGELLSNSFQRLQSNCFSFHAFQPNFFLSCADFFLMELGEWIIQGEKKFVGGHIDVPEFSFGELDDLQVPLTDNLNTFKLLKNWKGSYALWKTAWSEEFISVTHN